MNPTFYKLRRGKIISGVFAGLSDRFGLDVNLLRFLYILFSLFHYGIVGISIYVLCALSMPYKEDIEREKYADVIQEELGKLHEEFGRYEKRWKALEKDIEKVTKDVLHDAGIHKDSYKIVDTMYDRGSGVAAIAVYDKLTKETYIAYAGTNMDADGHKDPIVDLAIALNDTLYLKEKNKPALDFYDRVEASGYYISTTTGHSYGEFQAGRTAMERQVPS